jgi:hypothetical protein
VTIEGIMVHHTFSFHLWARKQSDIQTGMLFAVVKEDVPANNPAYQENLITFTASTEKIKFVMRGSTLESRIFISPEDWHFYGASYSLSLNKAMIILDG